LFTGDYKAVYNRAIDVASDLDFVDLKPITDAKLKKLLAMGYEIIVSKRLYVVCHYDQANAQRK